MIIRPLYMLFHIRKANKLHSITLFFNNNLVRYLPTYLLVHEYNTATDSTPRC
uniref:Uncharacterized protein n=1 Tax=Anguilla anguilla TaxID=7936 RepID=A0A0E9XT12_ANGAN